MILHLAVGIDLANQDIKSVGGNHIIGEGKLRHGAGLGLVDLLLAQ
jgi:hypothetical protein